MPNLIVYYSRKGENYWPGGLRVLEKGNTERAAEFIRQAVGGDLFEIDTVRPYSARYDRCIQEAKEELLAHARPELKGQPESLDGYDTIFVGYPSWWGTCPMAVFSFLERYDLSGKRIIPFCSNEGSGMGQSERDLAQSCKGAKVLPGLSIRGSETERLERRIAEWAKESLDNRD